METSIFSKPELIWFITGLGLFLLELILPGFVIFFFGIGAWVTALICLVAQPGTNLQIIIFAVTSVLALIGLRRMIQKKYFFSKGGLSEAVEDEFTGKEAIALTDFGPGKKGKIDFRGTSWTAISKSEIKEGQYVIIKEKESINITVEPKNN
jgi:membrane protein implicated in regulation of membrane protease activity